MTINLGTQSFFLPDGPIGWSYTNSDGLTAPLLVDVDPSRGTANALDHYAPPPASPASLAQTFTLGPGGLSNDPKENSFYLQLFENDVPSFTRVLQAGSNPGLLSSASAPIVWARRRGMPSSRSPAARGASCSGVGNRWVRPSAGAGRGVPWRSTSPPVVVVAPTTLTC